MATMGGINTTQEGMVSKTYGTGNMVLTDIHTGDWLALYGVDFGDEGAKTFTAAVSAKAGQEGAIEIRLDATDGEVVGYLYVHETDGEWAEVTTELTTAVTGVHDLVFVFAGEGYKVDYWQFGK